MNTILVFGAPDLQKFVDETAKSLEALSYLEKRHGSLQVEVRNRYFTCRLNFEAAASPDLSGQAADGYVVFSKPFKMPRRELLEESVLLAAPVESKDKEFYLDEDGLLFDYTLSSDELAFLLATAAYKHFTPLPDSRALAQKAQQKVQAEQDVSLEGILAGLSDARAREEILGLRDAMRKMLGDSDDATDAFGSVVLMMSRIQPYIKTLPDSDRRAAAAAVVLLLGDTFDAAADVAEGAEGTGDAEKADGGAEVEQLAERPPKSE